MCEKICVYTCITGDYDSLKEVNRESGIDYICFTNNPGLKSDTWEIISIENDGLDNIRLARKIKIIGHPFIDENYDLSIWVDGAIKITGSIKEFVEKECYINNYVLSVFKHSKRNNVYDEAVACVYNRRADLSMVKNEIEFIKSEGFQDDNGLIESTVFYKEHNQPIVKQTMKYWFDLILRYTTRDQIAFNYAIYKSGIKVNWIDKNVFFNEYFSWDNHLSKKDFSSGRIYYGEFNSLDNNNFEDLNLKCNDGVYEFCTQVKNSCDKIYIHLGQMPLYRFRLLDSNFSDFLEFNCLNKIGDYLILDNEMLILEIKKGCKYGDKVYFKFKLEKLSKKDILDVFKQVYYDKEYQKNILNDVKKDNELKQDYILALELQVKELEKIEKNAVWRFFKRIRVVK
ncbi:glycosyltransferase domain-containing protein [Thomasclavelia cocleata]|uniref:glycosyltransferase domain-containing protein n=1 Tax=Thomasclavelia cocleata TaxID=69824 RepID=UPI00242FE76D|nr:glycosyltransferase domain-containing protein [Thomasclavelia cocleata]